MWEQGRETRIARLIERERASEVWRKKSVLTLPAMKHIEFDVYGLQQLVVGSIPDIYHYTGIYMHNKQFICTELQ